MKTRFIFALAMLLGIGIGAVGIEVLYAQSKPPVYMIAINDVTDAEGYVREYTSPAAASITAHGGVTIARGFGTIIDGSLGHSCSLGQP